MKKIIVIFILFSLTLYVITSCGGSSKTIDICRCLKEPGNTEWSQENEDACSDAISKEIGVDNWEKVNMSQNPEISAKWDVLTKRCAALKENVIVENNQKNILISNIGTSSGYIWESVDAEAQVYATLAFDNLIFRTTAYAMNGKTNSEDFSKIINLSGSWIALDKENAKGVISANNVSVNWIFSNDYLSLTNNKGVVFKRIKVR